MVIFLTALFWIVFKKKNSIPIHLVVSLKKYL